MIADTESPLAPILTVVALVAMLAFLPSRYLITPAWTPAVIGFPFVALMIISEYNPGKPLLVRIERTALLGFIVFIMLAQLTVLWQLVGDMVRHNRGIPPITLLSTAIAIWTTNVIVFAFVYWLLDRGGPGDRNGPVDLSFVRNEDVPADWRPSFLDYFFVAFNTATAFSPTDTLPVTVRAKMYMMVESGISLVTVIVVGARAINLLGA